MNVNSGLRIVPIAVITFLILCATVHAQHLTPAHRADYHFSWDGISSVLKIDVFYNTQGKDSTVFIYGNPNPGGLTHIFEILSSVQIDPGDQLEINSRERKVKVLHRTSGLKKLHYEINGKLYADTKRARPNEAFRPTIERGFFYALGFNLFMNIANGRYSQLSLVWDHWPQHMPYFISCNPEARPDEPQIIAHDDRNMVLLQMNENLIIKKYTVKDIPNYLLTSKSDTINSMQEQMRPFINTLIPQMRDAWQDHAFDYYFISMIPLLNKVPSTMTGIGLKNGFSTRYSGPLDIEKTETIAHEVSHTWIGGRLKFKSVTMENEWFNEGVNDYVAIYHLAKAGILDSTAFLNYVNKEVFEPYYTNPHNTLPADSIEKYFWTSKDFEKIPYHRGFIYAFYLDNQIRLSSQGKYTLLNFLLHLYQQNRKRNIEVFTKVNFTEAAERFLNKEQVKSEIENYMLNGKLLDFHHIQLTEGFQVKYVNQVPKISLSPGMPLSKLYY
ncbi:MAG TPA: hypothetical protein VGK59_05080 [Ohtaekwangia sp.]